MLWWLIFFFAIIRTFSLFLLAFVKHLNVAAWSSAAQGLNDSRAGVKSYISDPVAGPGEEQWDQPVWFRHTFLFSLYVEVGCRWDGMCEGDRVKCVCMCVCVFLLFFLPKVSLLLYTCRLFCFPLRTHLSLSLFVSLSLGSVPRGEE